MKDNSKLDTGTFDCETLLVHYYRELSRMRDTFLRQSRREAIRESVTQTLGTTKVLGLGSAIGGGGAGGLRIPSLSTMGQPPRTQ